MQGFPSGEGGALGRRVCFYFGLNSLVVQVRLPDDVGSNMAVITSPRGSVWLVSVGVLKVSHILSFPLLLKR